MKKLAVLCSSVGVIGIALLVSGAIGALCWTYALNTWLVFFGKTIAIAWWQGALIGFVPMVGQLSIPVAVVTWILMMFLG